jgi:hypothetical protein
MNITRAIVLCIALCLAASLSVTCGGGSTGGVAYPANEQAFDAGALPSITQFISSAKSGDGTIQAQLVSGPPPISRNPAPALTVAAGGFTIPGGSKIVGLNAGANTFSRVLLKVNAATDYYELTGLPAASYNTIVFTIPQTAPASFTAGLAVSVGPTDPIGPYVPIGVNLTAVGLGDVQVSLAWDAPSDLDLHLVQPNPADGGTGGFEIYYGATVDTSTQGKLDLDSNAACNIDNKNNENITFQGGTPLRGNYIVRVDNWKACGQTRINYVVTVNVKGQPTQTFVGVFTDTGDLGGLGSGTTMTADGGWPPDAGLLPDGGLPYTFAY